MGSEHSAQLQQGASGAADGTLRTGSLHRHSTTNPATASRSGGSGTSGKLQRGNTIAVTGTIPSGGSGTMDDGYSTSSVTPSSAYICDSRPVSPPMSVCSDSDLPYISYTDKPIGDSPKLRNKQQSKQTKTRPNSAIIMSRAAQQQQHNYQQHLTQHLEGRGGGRGGRPGTGGAHSIVVVKSAAVRDVGIEKDDDIVRLQVRDVIRGMFSPRDSLTRSLGKPTPTRFVADSRTLTGFFGSSLSSAMVHPLWKLMLDRRCRWELRLCSGSSEPAWWRWPLVGVVCVDEQMLER
uniref:Uncharacterized protein n=1 Tax=Anopheles funestus TaxID=62324 RepID=A0A4Y0BJK8_ANOFN